MPINCFLAIVMATRRCFGRGAGTGGCVGLSFLLLVLVLLLLPLLPLLLLLLLLLTTIDFATVTITAVVAAAAAAAAAAVSAMPTAHTAETTNTPSTPPATAYRDVSVVWADDAGAAVGRTDCRHQEPVRCGRFTRQYEGVASAALTTVVGVRGRHVRGGSPGFHPATLHAIHGH